jgi:predicted Zn-dependent peptidase
MKPKLEKLLGALTAGEGYRPMADPGVTRPASPRLLLVDKPDATQTYFYISQPGIRRGHPDDTALRLVNTLFGGRFTSMLNDELRVNSGLTYGAGSSVELNRMTGAITISTFTKTESTEQAIDLALATLKRLHEKGITADQLKSAKAYVKGTLPLEQLETTDQVAGVLGSIELFGLNRGEIDDLFSRIDAVTVERANQVIRQYYRPENLVFTLLGNASKIRSAAKKYSASVTEVPVTKPGYGWL